MPLPNDSTSHPEGKYHHLWTPSSNFEQKLTPPKIQWTLDTLHSSAVLITAPFPPDQTFHMQPINVLNLHPILPSHIGKPPDVLFVTYSTPKTTVYFTPQKGKE